MVEDIIETLEKIVDKYGLSDVMVALELMCIEKADHIVAYYQDKRLAQRWRNCGRMMYRAACYTQRTLP